MIHSRTIATVRRSSQRRNHKRLSRLQRQVAFETVVSNLSSLVHQPATTIITQPSIDSIQTAEQNDNKDIDNLCLSMSSGSLNISYVQGNFIQSMTNTEINTINEFQQENQIPSLSSSSSTSKEIKAGEEIVKVPDVYDNPDEDIDENNDEEIDENNDEEKYLTDSDDEETPASVDADDDELFANYKNLTDRKFTCKEVAVALSLLKARYSLTNTCISSICKLLKLLRISNSPTNFRHVRSLICQPYQTTIFGTFSISCPSCRKSSSNPLHCTSSPTCISKDKFVLNPTINHILHMEPQIRAVLERNDLIKPKNDETIITDIVDAPFYRKLLRAEPNPFISLVMNSDGAVVKSISRSIWITTFVINELPRSVRFNRENLIIGMISVGSSKPSKDEMQIFLSDLVKELIYLENKGLEYNPPNSSSHIEKNVRVYLIAATCDMPATSLMINHTESTGYFGCPHCKIQGENIKVGDGNARVFVYNDNDNSELRSNKSYDEAIRLLEQPIGRRRRASVNSINNELDGLKGPCCLRLLKHFDVYQSFTCDTLHTLYEGVTGRMLKILFGNVSEKSGITARMSVKKFINTVASTFKSTFYPSSTYRIPRDLKLHSVYKANEFKIFLLFGFSIFDGILTPERFDHFRCLTFAAHLIEAFQHTQSTYREVAELLHEFDKRFEGLYKKQHAKPVIHGLSHFADSIRKYGPGYNFSTFEFESAVAALTRTIHSGNKPTVELLNNIDLLQQTWLATTDPSFPPEIQLFDRQINSNMHYSIPKFLSDIDHHHKPRLLKKMSINALLMDVSDFIFKFTGDRSYVLYRSIFVDHQRYSADPINVHRSTHDGCVLYDKDDVTTVGFLETIIHFIDDNELSLVIRPVILHSTADTLSINDRVYQCTNVLYGTSHGSSIEVIHYKSLIQKLAFRYGTNLNFPPLVKSMFFFQFPNLHSST